MSDTTTPSLLTPVLTYLSELVPKGEPAVLVSYIVAALTAAVGWLTLHHVIPISIAASPDVKNFLPVVAGLIIALAGHLIRPLVTPNSKLPAPLEAVLSSVAGVLDGSDGFPVPADNSALDTEPVSAAAASVLAADPVPAATPVTGA